MAGLDPAIHENLSWIPGPSPGRRPGGAAQGGGDGVGVVEGGGADETQVFIASKNSALLFDSLSLLIRNSSPSLVPIGISTRRKTHIFDRTPRSTSSSSLRVPDFVMSSAGKVRLSATLRSSTISELPVPLNSSKITSSMRDPVSISAVAMIFSEPPSSMLRAAPKNRFGRCNALASTPPVSTLPEDGTTVL